MAEALTRARAVLGELWRETPPMVKLFLIRTMVELMQQPSALDALSDASTLLDMAYAEMKRVSELEERARMALARARA